MKAIISIFAALLLVVVGNYAEANEVSVATRKATNGANDPSVQVIREDKKQTSKVTAADLKDFSTRSFDDRVLEFRRGDELITMVPLSDFWWSKERRAAFEASQVLAEQLMQVWLKEALGIRYGGNQAAVEQQLVNMTADQIRAKYANGGMPTRAEIIAAAGDARDASKKLQERAKFLVEYDELIATFDKYQDDNLADSVLGEKLTPSAFMFVASVKLPASVVAAAEKTRIFKSLATILNSSLTFTATVRPWKVVKRNLNTGVQTTATYYETSTQAWAMKDFNTDKLAVKGPLKLGAGLLFGNFNRMANVHGGAIGGSYSFNAKKSMLAGELPIPTHWNVKYGVITAAAETLTGALDIRNVAKHGYLMVTKQFGYQTPTGRMANGDIGAVVNFTAIADKFGSFDQKALDGIIEAALEIPGADVVVQDDQVEILIPDQHKPLVAPTQPKQETAPTPVNPVP